MFNEETSWLRNFSIADIKSGQGNTLQIFHHTDLEHSDRQACVSHTQQPRPPNLRLLMKILAALPLCLSLADSKKRVVFTNSTMLQPCIKYALLKYGIYKQKTGRPILMAFPWSQSKIPIFRTASARHLFAVLSETVSFLC